MDVSRNGIVAAQREGKRKATKAKLCEIVHPATRLAKVRERSANKPPRTQPGDGMLRQPTRVNSLNSKRVESEAAWRLHLCPAPPAVIPASTPASSPTPTPARFHSQRHGILYAPPRRSYSYASLFPLWVLRPWFRSSMFPLSAPLVRVSSPL